jgi:GTP-binding protein HflX
MAIMIETEKDNRKMVERALLVGIQEPEGTLAEAREHLWELRELVSTLGIPTVHQIIVNLREPNPKYLLGSGKAEEIRELATEHKVDCIVFDCELSPSQQRNWEKLTRLCVIERQEVILDIFAQRASTREAVIQIDLARMQYSLPRLTRAWTHLSRQRGGAQGTRGEGEQQIEVDKRIIQDRIAQLRREFKEVRKHRDTQRKNRLRQGIPQTAIVGYTNAGKSSLLNRLSGSDVLVENKLFATLDPTTRRIQLPNASREMLLTDTVGFIRKLPHQLVEAFKATLEEAVLADLLVHVLDVSSPHVEHHYATTLAVLEELGSEGKPMLTVFNKVDLLENPVTRVRLLAMHPDCIFVSTVTGEGIDQLLSRLTLSTHKDTEILELLLPPDRHDVLSRAHREARVLSTQYEENGAIHVTVSVPARKAADFREFQTPTT